MRPQMIVIAGPIASGKTGLFRKHVERTHIDAFNVDDECARLNHGSYQNVGREIVETAIEHCERFVDEHIAERRSFLVETTLRTTVALDQAGRARAAGFTTHMLYVSTNDPEINVERALTRQDGGGRDIDPATVRSVYGVSLTNLPRAIREFDTVSLYDNSEDLGELTPQLETLRGEPVYEPPRPQRWAAEALAASRRQPRGRSGRR